MTDRPSLTVNGRRYAWPKAPVVVVCIDGSEPAYMDEAVAAGVMPWLARARTEGTDRLSECVVPSFTNPNNISIVTGVPPSVHGISGNYFLDPESGEEVMMTDPKFLRCGTILAAFADAGAKVAVVTAKDKLRRILGHGLFAKGNGVCFSSEKADAASHADNGIGRVVETVGLPVPSVYSADLSEFVFAAGVKLMEGAWPEVGKPDILYLSTTDYIQHKHAPGTAEANAFYAMMDRYWARLAALGCTIALTADHGMNAKHRADGSPAVIYIQDFLDGRYGAGATRTILPITDPYVVHHGALGSFAAVYLSDGLDAEKVAADIGAIEGVTLVLDRKAAAARFGLPADRIGDLTVVSEKHVTLGTRAAEHDLSGLEVPLRSHGGTTEQTVPLILNRACPRLAADRKLRNFDAFDLALNEAAVVAGARAAAE